MLNGLSEIYTYFRKNTMPWYFVSPTSFNLLGLDQWVHKFNYVNYLDTFDGAHPRVVIPRDLPPRKFKSMEEINNYLLMHKEIREIFQLNGKKGKIITVMFNDETEEIIKNLGMELALPSNQLRNHFDSKLVVSDYAQKAGVACVPNTISQIDNYNSLLRITSGAGLGTDLVLQAAYGDSGKTTFFVSSEKDWTKCASKVKGQEIKIMKRIDHIPVTLEAVATRLGTIVGPIMTDITGFAELTPYKGGWCGNDASSKIIDQQTRNTIQSMSRAMGDCLYKEGFKGVFCLDFLIDKDNGKVYLGEINPRISGITALTNLVTSKYGGVPLFLFHLLEFADVDYSVDIEQIQLRWLEYDTWSQLFMKQTEDKYELITKAPSSGIWNINSYGKLKFVRKSLDWNAVSDNNEAYYMRIHGEGQYRYYGADMGLLVFRSRKQTDDRQLHDDGKIWAQKMLAQFKSVPAS